MLFIGTFLKQRSSRSSLEEDKENEGLNIFLMAILGFCMPKQDMSGCTVACKSLRFAIVLFEMLNLSALSWHAVIILV